MEKISDVVSAITDMYYLLFRNTAARRISINYGIIITSGFILFY